MILEALIRCPYCRTRNAVPSIAPFVWWYLLAGKRCYQCGGRFDVKAAKEDQ